MMHENDYRQIEEKKHIHALNNAKKWFKANKRLTHVPSTTILEIQLFKK